MIRGSRILVVLELAAIAVALGFAPMTGAWAATITVNTLADPGSSGVCALRDAITAANTMAAVNGCAAGTGTDTINFSVSGTITLSSVLPAIANSSGGSLTIDGTGQTIAIDGAGSYEVLFINTGAVLNLTSLTITDGNNGSNFGGGINNNGALTITNSTLSSNVSGSNGGAIYNAGDLTVSGSTFSKNAANSGGAAIYDNGPANLTVSDTVFDSNKSTISPSGSGAAILHGGGNAVITGCTISNNSDTYRGAVLNQGPMTITDSTFVNNGGAPSNGGAIWNQGALSVINSTFTGNSSQLAGGAIWNAGETITVENSTLSGNSSGSGGGIFINGGTGTVSNSILADNAGENCAYVTDGGYNISDDTSCGFVGTGANGDTIGDGVSDSNIALDPHGLQNNGGPTQTIALVSPSSFAVNAIPNDLCPATDQRGVTRPDSGESACDIGAFELHDCTTPPSITISQPAATTYLLNQLQPAIYTCGSSCSTIPAGDCVGTVADGSNIDTSSVGTKTFTVNAEDAIGQTSTATVDYTVAYNICPLYQQSAAVHLGATIPIKLELCDMSGNDFSSSSVVVHATGLTPLSNESSAVIEDSGNSNPDDDFRFDSTLGPTGGYIFNLKTSDLSSGTWGLAFTASGDSTSHQVQFGVK